MMIWRFFDKDDAPLFQRADAVSFLHHCEDFAFEATFPAVPGKPLTPGMRVAWQDDDDLWEVHEITQAEPSVLDGSVDISGVHIALAELRDMRMGAVSITNASVPSAMDTVLTGTGWARGVLPADLEDSSRRARYRVTQSPGAHLRVKPTTNSKSLATYKKGTYVTLIEQTTPRWYKCEGPDGRVGYLYTQYITADGTAPASSTTVSVEDDHPTCWMTLEAIAGEAKLLLLPRVEISDSGTFTRYIDMRTTAPIFRGVRLTCSTNIREAFVREDQSTLYTALIGIGKDGLKFTDTVWTAPTNPVDKPAGQDYVEIASATEAYGRSGRPRIGVVRFSDVEDAGELLEKTYEQVKYSSQPQITLDVTIADLYKLGYGGQSIRLYDVAHVILEPIDMRLETRITALTRDLVHPERTRPTFGRAVDNIVAILAQTAAQTGHIADWQAVPT